MSLPSINDLYSGELVKKQNQLSVLLNQEPKKDWIKVHPFGKFKYIPIERVEWLLKNIFVKWRVEVKDIQLIANSTVVTVRLYYLDPISGEWDWQDGIGAAPLQTDKGAAAADWNAIKNDSVMKAAPAAESYAIKDAAEKIGKLFGADLNRGDQIMYDALANKFEKVDQREAELMDLIRTLPSESQAEYLEILKTKTEAGEKDGQLIENMIGAIKLEL